MNTEDKNQEQYHSDDAVNKKNEIGNREGLDSEVNTSFEDNSDGNESLTNDESADTDPNEVKDKPSFK